MDPLGRKYSWNDAEEVEGKKIILFRVDMDSVSLRPVKGQKDQQGVTLSLKLVSPDSFPSNGGPLWCWINALAGRDEDNASF